MEEDNITTTSTVTSDKKTLEQWKQCLQRELERAEAAFDLPKGSICLEFTATSPSWFRRAYLVLFTNVIPLPIDDFAELIRHKGPLCFNVLENILPLFKFQFFLKAASLKDYRHMYELAVDKLLEVGDAVSIATYLCFDAVTWFPSQLVQNHLKAKGHSVEVHCDKKEGGGYRVHTRIDGCCVIIENSQ